MGDGRWGARDAGRWVAVAVGATLVAATLAVGAVPAGAATSADLAVTLSRTPSLGQALVDTITFTAVVRNDGPDTAEGVILVDPLGSLSATIGDVTTTRGSCETEQAQVVCELGDLASGASGTVTIETVLGESGLVTNSVGVVAVTADPDDSDNTASASVVLTEPPPIAELIVRGYFDLVLGLDATEGQVERWSEKLETYGYFSYSFTLDLLRTSTFRKRFVQETYASMLGRPADPAGLALFTRKLGQRVTYEQIKATIAASSEYYAKAGGTEEGFVDELVKDLTGHPPAAQLRLSLLEKLVNGASRSSVAYSVATSDIARSAWVKWQFRRYYEREPESYEVEDALWRFHFGTRPAMVLAQHLAGPDILFRFLPDGSWGEVATRD